MHVSTLSNFTFTYNRNIVFSVTSNDTSTTSRTSIKIKNYNGKDYTFRKIEVISSGERDADGDTFAISGTKMRRAAEAGDFEGFKKGIPKALGPKETRNLFDEIAELL